MPTKHTKASILTSILFVSWSFQVVANEHLNNSQSINSESNRSYKFSEHSFGANCFNAKNCKVLYAHRYELSTPVDQWEPNIPADYPKNLIAHHIAIPNFPSPATVEWQSIDGTSHNAVIDISAIFKSQEILHNVKPEDIKNGAYITPPDIILVVNDKNISVYMRAHIPLRKDIDGRHKGMKSVDEPVLAFSKNY